MKNTYTLDVTYTFEHFKGTTDTHTEKVVRPDYQSAIAWFETLCLDHTENVLNYGVRRCACIIKLVKDSDEELMKILTIKNH